MDADCKEKRREWGLQPPKIVKRHDRFSMDQQRFDEILAEITTGYSNIRSSFENVNIAEILEEMVTEYARAALEAEAPPKFAELAVLLQHCAALYGRKVDYLYQHVVDVSEALATAAPAPAGASTPHSQSGSAGARRRQRASGAAAGFGHIELSACCGAARARSPPRAPPTLPRMYIELEPRVPAPHEEPLRDAAGEPVGLPADYYVAGRLHDGYLVEELEAAADRAAALRPLSLLELQEALAAAAPLLTPPPHSRTPSPEPDAIVPDASVPAACAPDTSVPDASEPDASMPDASEPDASVPDACAPLARRKRRSSAKLADIVGSPPLKAFITEELVSLARVRCEFSPPEEWVSREVRRRARRLLDARRDLRPLPRGEFRGFEDEHPDAGGFPGWSGAECAAATARAAAEGDSLRACDLESDDDGFFEGSSFSSLDSSRSTPPLPAPAPAPAPPVAPPPPPPDVDAAWSARVAARALAEEARGGVDVRALGAAVLRALPASPAPAALPFAELLRRAAARQRDVSRVLLATLFLANSGNVEISGAAPLALGEFSVALLSADERLYAAAADAEAALHAPAADAEVALHAPAADAEAVLHAPAPPGPA